MAAKKETNSIEETNSTPEADNVEATSSAGDTVFELPSQIDISSAAKLCDDIKAIYTSNNITLDAGKVDRITTPGIQILLAITTTAKSRGGLVTITKPSEIFQSIISDLGFSNQLKEWIGSDV